MSTDPFIARERKLDQHATQAALSLLDACHALGWGSTNPIDAAIERIRTVAQASGLDVLYTAPAPVVASPITPTRRKKLTQGVKRAVWDRDGWTCVTCGGHEDLSVDHRIPVSAGGTNDIDNLQTMCRPCNLAKGAKV